MPSRFLATLAVLPHAEQRYDTCGDWRVLKNGSLAIDVSAMGDWRYEMLVAFHELAEALVCRHKGISQSDVDAFDIAYEKNRRDGDVSEPGDDPAAPYHAAHLFATKVEEMLAAELDVDWTDYTKAIEAL